MIDSNYAKEFNPYTDYLYALPPWDGTDYIAQLADTLTTENRELWQEGFKRWIVGLVDCALSDEDMNQLVIILYSEQGKGKSSWIRRLLPPEWKEYFYNGIIDPSNKDDAPPARHANHHQHGGVRRREARRAGSIEANHRAGQRDAAQGLRHRSLHPAPPLLLHREHQQPAVPAGHRRKPGVSSPSPSPA